MTQGMNKFRIIKKNFEYGKDPDVTISFNLGQSSYNNFSSEYQKDKPVSLVNLKYQNALNTSSI